LAFAQPIAPAIDTAGTPSLVGASGDVAKTIGAGVAAACAAQKRPRATSS
jgi:hypothetical protein